LGKREGGSEPVHREEGERRGFFLILREGIESRGEGGGVAHSWEKGGGFLSGGGGQAKVRKEGDFLLKKRDFSSFFLEEAVDGLRKDGSFLFKEKRGGPYAANRKR